MYLPGVVVALAAGAAVAAAGSVLTRRTGLTLAAAAVAWLAIIGSVARQQVGWWHDSITLWTRTLDLDSTNDLASYNLAVALTDAGRIDDAIARYEQTLRLVPDQSLARENRDRLVVQRDQAAGDHSLQSGRLEDAVESYSRALAIDPHLTRARSGRGIALARSGRVREAIEDLQDAFDETSDPGVADALAFALADSGRTSEAVDVLKRALAQHRDNAELAGNLARLLAASPDVAVRDPALALRLALQVRDQTGGGDPRVLDTLAAAYAATDQPDLARQTIAEAVRLARQQGQAGLANEIEFHARTYGR
jgi:tetratricopeptide (TPR) repeat protein